MSVLLSVCSALHNHRSIPLSTHSHPVRFRLAVWVSPVQGCFRVEKRVNFFVIFRLES